MKRLIAGFAGVGLAFLALTIVGAFAETYPARSITVVVPFSAGGPTDVLARVLAQRMGQSLGQQIIVEVTGSNNIAAEMTLSTRLVEIFRAIKQAA